MPGISQLLETSLYAEDLDAAEEFYSKVLGLDVHAREAGRHVFFRCGKGMLLIFDPRHTSSKHTEVAGQVIPLHGATGAGHVCFAIDDPAGWRDRLQQGGVEIESVVEWPGGGTSLYFRDPAGNSVELATPTIWLGGDRPPRPNDSP